MQTFLPYPNFQRSAIVLDRQRLGKQRVEGYQILRTLVGISTGWSNHPATRMWRGYTPALRHYTQVCIDEWLHRGYKNTIVLPDALPTDDKGYPPWLGDPTIHASHRSNLLRKMPQHYACYGWTEPSDLPYVWPV